MQRPHEGSDERFTIGSKGQQTRGTGIRNSLKNSYLLVDGLTGLFVFKFELVIRERNDFHSPARVGLEGHLPGAAVFVGCLEPRQCWLAVDERVRSWEGAAGEACEWVLGGGLLLVVEGGGKER